MKTRFFPTVFTLVLARGTACSLPTSAFASKEKPVIGLSLDTTKEERWQRDRDTFIAKAESLGGKVITQSANGDDTLQVRNIEALISRGVDVIVIVPHNGEALTRAVKAAKDAKIPVIAYDRLIMNCDIDLYLTFDNVKVGELQAKYVADHLPAGRPAKVVRVFGAPTDNNAKLFKQGQDNVILPLVKAGKVEIVFEDWALDWKPENAKKIVNAAITKNGKEIDAVIASADSVAGGVIQALREEGLAGKVIVTGQDADLAACRRILSGQQTMTIYKPLKKLADYAAIAAIDLAKGNAIQSTATLDNGFKKVPAVFQDVISVDKSNLQSTVVADGFQKASDLK